MQAESVYDLVMRTLREMDEFSDRKGWRGMHERTVAASFSHREERALTNPHCASVDPSEGIYNATVLSSVMHAA